MQRHRTFFQLGICASRYRKLTAFYSVFPSMALGNTALPMLKNDDPHFSWLDMRICFWVCRCPRSLTVPCSALKQSLLWSVLPTNRPERRICRRGRRRIRMPSNAQGGNMGILTWILVGLIAGWLAGRVMKGGGYGVLVDIILGILGGILGGWIFGALGIWHGGGLIGSVIVAFVGAVILVWITRLLKKA